MCVFIKNFPSFFPLCQSCSFHAFPTLLAHKSFIFPAPHKGRWLMTGNQSCVTLCWLILLMKIILSVLFGTICWTFSTSVYIFRSSNPPGWSVCVTTREDRISRSCLGVSGWTLPPALSDYGDWSGACRGCNTQCTSAWLCWTRWSQWQLKWSQEAAERLLWIRGEFRG